MSLDSDMQDDLTKAQRYRTLAEGMEGLAMGEPDEARRAELYRLAEQYRRLVDSMIERHP